MNRRTLLVLIDGATDHRSDEVGGTPLEVADKPNIDGIASSGMYGCTDGRPYTHRFLIELLTGRISDASRGPVEALGAGMPVDGRVAYRLSPAIVEDDMVRWVYRVDDAASRRMASSIRRWMHLVDEGCECAMYSGGRGILTVPGKDAYEGPMPPSDGRVVGDLGRLSDLCDHVAEDNHGITSMPWGGALADSVRCSPLVSAEGIKVLSKSPSALGVGAALGLGTECIMPLEERFERALTLLGTNDVLLHVEETDDVSHRRMPRAKVDMIERVDRLIGTMRGDFDVMLLVDHGASSVTGEHIAHRVPFAHSPSMEGKGTCFCESAGRYVPLVGLLDSLMGPR